MNLGYTVVGNGWDFGAARQTTDDNRGSCCEQP